MIEQDMEGVIKSPTRVTEKKSSLLHHVLINSLEILLQSGEVKDAGVSDHQLIYCILYNYMYWKVLYPKTMDI